MYPKLSMCFTMSLLVVAVTSKTPSGDLFARPHGEVIEVYRDDRFLGGIPLLHGEGGQASTIPYVFLSDVGAVFRGSLHWFQVSGKVRLAIRHHWVDFFPGEDVVSVGGWRHRLPYPLYEADGKLAIPVSFLSSQPFMEAAGYHVEWDGAKQVLQLTSSESRGGHPTTPPPPVVAVPERTLVEEDTHASKPRSARRLHRIVIDAGHGGHDPGAVGYRRTKEKEINLLFAREFARTLRERGGYDVFLTRDDDTFIPLADRAQFANERQADLFLSVHCNASMSSHGHGFEIYFLSEKASDPQAEAVARFENSVIELEGRSPKERKEVERLLWSLIRTDTINEASQLCGVITRQVEKRKVTESRGVKQAGFYVLRGTEMPAALVELAFITNPRDERSLRDRRFRKRLIDALMAGVMEFEGREPKKTAREKRAALRQGLDETD